MCRPPSPAGSDHVWWWRGERRSEVEEADGGGQRSGRDFPKVVAGKGVATLSYLQLPRRRSGRQTRGGRRGIRLRDDSSPDSGAAAIKGQKKKRAFLKIESAAADASPDPGDPAPLCTNVAVTTGSGETSRIARTDGNGVAERPAEREKLCRHRNAAPY